MKMNYWKLAIIALVFTCLPACNENPDDDIDQKTAPQAVTTVTGFYVLNEGLMSQNNSTLDHYDYETGTYTKNIFMKTNADVADALGSGANDILIYGTKVYITLTNSDKIEILDVKTHKRIKILNLDKGRNICAANGKVYITSYANFEDAQNPRGTVFEVDTTTLNISNKVLVGRRPEGISYANYKLYVANSGGYKDYENIMSIIDTRSFTKTKDVEIAINPTNTIHDGYQNIYIASAGDYTANNTPKLSVYNIATEKVTKTYDFSAGRMALVGDTLYVLGSKGNPGTLTYKMINVKTNTLLPDGRVTKTNDETFTTPYSFAVDPASRTIYVTDAKSYVVEGSLTFFDKEGKQTNEITTGIIPAKIAFISKTVMVEK